MRAEPGTLLLWLLLTSTAAQAAPAEPGDDLAFLEFLALMIEDGDDWIDPLTASQTLSREAEQQRPEAPDAKRPRTEPTPPPEFGDQTP